MEKPVLFKIEDHILIITLNRPEKKNAITNEMYALISESLIDAGNNPDVRAVFLSARGDAFSSGNDLKDFAAVNRGEAKEIAERPVAKFLRTMVTFEKPVVAAVKGLAVGIGATMLLHCDLVYAGQSATFHLPFIQLGLVPEFASSRLLPRLAGKAQASAALLLGEPFNAQTAKEMGLINEILEGDKLEKHAYGKCLKLAGMPPKSLRTIKALLTPPEDRQRILDTIAKETKIFGECLKSEEHREALSAFFEKRKPDFSKFS